jgi:hypothetical protein
MEFPMKSAPRMDVVKREDKEDKLKQFISAHLTAVTASPGHSATWLLIARSSQSPVVKALNALVAEMAKAQITVRTILAVLDNGTSDMQAGATQTEATMLCPTECRVARNPRLLEAHEQLVMGPATCWIGDSMRREPDKRDAYECYASDHALTAHWSTISFNRLWAASDALVPRGAVLPVDVVPVDELAQVEPSATDLPPVAEVAAVSTVSTRH